MDISCQCDLPDAIFVEIFSFLPLATFLPVANVSRRYRICWLKTKALGLLDANVKEAESASQKGSQTDNEDVLKSGDKPNLNHDRLVDFLIDGDDDNKHTKLCFHPSFYQSNPLELGNLFESSWSKRNQTALNVDLLEYYLSCGWVKDDNSTISSCNKSIACDDYSKSEQLDVGEKSSDIGGSSRPSAFAMVMEKIVLGAAIRGDVKCIEYLLAKNYIPPLNNPEYCCIAGAAGQLDMLKWLREKQNCPWNPIDVHREASENLHHDVMTYVELNSKDNIYRLSTYGDGLPW